MMSDFNRPIDKAILIYFRICMGILLTQELINSFIIGKFNEYVTPKVHFTYLYFEWVRPWSYEGMLLHYLITILAGLMVAAGIFYRFSATLLFFGYTSLFLMEMSEYINHHYLYCLLSFWMIFLPLKNDDKATAPAWTLRLILFHMALAYFYGGIAKLNSDWLRGTPMDLFLEARKDYALGFLYSQDWSPLFFSYGGLCFDLLIVPAMLIPRTRKFGLIASLFFHLSNVAMFGLATFPWFSLVLTTMFFNPSWPRKVLFFNKFVPLQKEELRTQTKPFLASLLLTYVLLHLALPLRHWFYPGNPSWTEEGHMFAWRMMLRSKSGKSWFQVHHQRTKKIHLIRPEDFLSQRQMNDMLGNPDMILQFAHYLRDKFQKEWNAPVSVYASSRVSLNGRPMQELIKPGTDLAQEVRSIKHYRWIMPLK